MPKVEVIYATLEQQKPIVVDVEEQATIELCIKLSGILTAHPELKSIELKTGIFSQVKPLSHEVSDGDRIEIYRPLIADPKAVRRKKAEMATVKKPPQS